MTITDEVFAAAEQAAAEKRAAADAAKAVYWPDLEHAAREAEDWAGAVRERQAAEQGGSS